MFIKNQSAEEYHNSPYIGSTTAKLALKSSQLFGDKMTGIYKTEDKPHFQIGRLIHEMILEPELFAKRIVTAGPINPKTGEPYGRSTQKFSEWQIENPHLTMVESYIPLALSRMPQSVRDIFTGGDAELSVYRDLSNGLKVKCRNDYIKDGTIYDVKTCVDVDDYARDIARRDYYFSASWYRMVMAEETGESHEFKLVFVEKSAPFRYKIVSLTDAYKEYADNKVADVLELLAERQESGDWSDASPIEVIADLPHYLTDDLTINEEGISL
jgi:hypothetical protein